MMFDNPAGPRQTISEILFTFLGLPSLRHTLPLPAIGAAFDLPLSVNVGIGSCQSKLSLVFSNITSRSVSCLMSRPAPGVNGAASCCRTAARNFRVHASRGLAPTQPLPLPSCCLDARAARRLRNIRRWRANDDPELSS